MATSLLSEEVETVALGEAGQLGSREGEGADAGAYTPFLADMRSP